MNETDSYADIAGVDRYERPKRGPLTIYSTPTLEILQQLIKCMFSNSITTYFSSWWIEKLNSLFQGEPYRATLTMLLAVPTPLPMTGRDDSCQRGGKRSSIGKWLVGSFGFGRER